MNKNEASIISKIFDNVSISFFKPEIRDCMDEALEKWREYITHKPKDYEVNVFNFIHWLYIEEKLVTPKLDFLNNQSNIINNDNIQTLEYAVIYAFGRWEEYVVQRERNNSEIEDYIYTFAYWSYRYSGLFIPNVKEDEE